MSFWNAPGYTATAPQQEASIQGAAVFMAAAVLSFGPVSAAEYTFGTHAQAIYNAEAAKSKVRPALVAKSGTTPRVPNYIAGAGPQNDPAAAGHFTIYPPLPIIVPANVTPFVSTAVPQYDPLSAGSVYEFSAASQSGGGLRPFITGSVDDSKLYNAEASKTKVRPSVQPGVLLPPVPPLVYAADPNTPALYGEAGKHQVWPAAASSVQTGAPLAFTTASPQRIDLTLQPFIDAPSFNQQGWLIPFSEAEPQSGAEFQPQPSITPQAFSTPRQPLRPYWAEPQRVDLTLPPLVIRAVQNPQGPSLPRIFAAPQWVDLTVPPEFIKAGLAVLQGPVIRGFFVPPLPVDLTLGAQVWRAAPTAQPVAAYVNASPQKFDHTLPAQVRAAAPTPPTFMTGLGSFVLVPAQRPDQAAGSALWTSAQPAPSHALGSYYRAAPWLEPSQPAPLHWSPVVGTPPKVGILGSFIAATPDSQVLQPGPFALFSRLSPAPSHLFGWAEIIALKQLGVSGVNVVLAALSQAGVEGAESRFLANSACFVTAQYFDINNVAFVPAAVSYRIDDLISQENIVPWTSITPALTNTVTVTSAQNGMISLSRKSECHQMLFLIVDGAGNDCYARVQWDIVQTLGAPT